MLSAKEAYDLYKQNKIDITCELQKLNKLVINAAENGTRNIAVDFHYPSPNMATEIKNQLIDLGYVLSSNTDKLIISW